MLSHIIPLSCKHSFCYLKNMYNADIPGKGGLSIFERVLFRKKDCAIRYYTESGPNESFPVFDYLHDAYRHEA